MNGYTDEELKELEEMIALEELMELEREETEAELKFYKQPHTDEEWKEHAKKEMLESGCPEEDLEKYFYYDSETHEYYHNEEGKKYTDNYSRLDEKWNNFFREAEAMGMAASFPGNPFMNQPNSQEESVNTEYARLSSLSHRGLAAATFDSPSVRDIDTSYAIDGIKHDGCTMLYHNGEEVGVFYDDCSDFAKPAPHERHVEELLKIVTKHDISLLLIYWENNGKPIWEVYLNGKFVRQQSTVYSYDGYVYDKKKMSRMAELKDADIGSIQKALMELNKEAEELVYLDEKKIRIDENTRTHAEWADVVSKMQQKYQQVGFVVSLLNTDADNELDEKSRNAICAALDSFSETIVPGLVASVYEEKAKKIYPFYPKVALSSQRYLLTAVALEEHLTAEHYDICPLYIELCRVFENELDIRIFSEYIGILVRSKDAIIDQKSGKFNCFRTIREQIAKASGLDARIFVPEQVKVASLHLVDKDYDKASVYQTILRNLLEEKQFDLKVLTRKADFEENRKYVGNRNRFTHPDDELDAAELQKELQSIKEQTNARMEWLIEATQGQE